MIQRNKFPHFRIMYRCIDQEVQWHYHIIKHRGWIRRNDVTNDSARRRHVELFFYFVSVARKTAVSQCTCSRMRRADVRYSGTSTVCLILICSITKTILVINTRAAKTMSCQDNSERSIRECSDDAAADDDGLQMRAQ